MTTETSVVADVMTTQPDALRADSSLEEADLVLRSTRVMGVPVVDSDGILVGVVTHAHLAVYRFARSEPPVDSTGTSPARAKE